MEIVKILLKAGANVNIKDKNNFTPLDLSLHQNHKKIISLFLDQNNLTENSFLSSQSFSSSHLILKLNSIELFRFPENLKVLSRSLTSLDLSGNPIPSIPSSLSSLSLLIYLNLSNLNLKTFPFVILSLQKLEELNLAKNLIDFLPVQIDLLSNLIKLNLYDNKIESLPSNLGKMTKLGVLNIEKNPMTSIPLEILNSNTNNLLEYLSQLSGQTTTWKRVKLMFLGEENVGKTSFVFFIYFILFYLFLYLLYYYDYYYYLLLLLLLLFIIIIYY